MTAPLYNEHILRLTTEVPDRRLAAPMATSEKRSPVCGSRVTVDINLAADGRVSEIGMLARACALGQASAALLAAHVVARSPDELASARELTYSRRRWRIRHATPRSVSPSRRRPKRQPTRGEP